MESNLIKIQEKATDILGDRERALEWMDHMSGTLGDTPRNLAKTSAGTDRVLIHLGGISRHSLN